MRVLRFQFSLFENSHLPEYDAAYLRKRILNIQKNVMPSSARVWSSENCSAFTIIQGRIVVSQ